MSNSGATPLLKYALMVRRRWILILVVLIAMAVPAYVVSTWQTPSYRATAQVLLARQELDENFNPTSNVLTDTQINNEIALLMSDDVFKLAVPLGATEPIRVAGGSSTNIVTLTADAPRPERAAATVSAVVKAYSDYRTATRRQALDKAAAQLQLAAGDLQAQFGKLKSDEDADQRTALLQRLGTLQTRLSQVQTQQQLTAAGLTVVHAAVVPTEPTSPTPIRNTLLALVLGLMLGISLAVLLESLRQRPVDSAGPGGRNGSEQNHRLPRGSEYATAGIAGDRPATETTSNGYSTHRHG